MAKPYVPGIAPEMADESNRAKAEALRRAVRAGLIGLGAGGGLATLLAVPRLISKPDIPSYPLQTEIDLPYPQEVRKAANLLTESLGAPLGAGTFGAVREGLKAKEPAEGALYGAVQGSTRGLAAVPTSLAGLGLGELIAKRLAGRQDVASRALRAKSPQWLGGRSVLPLILQALGGGVGYAASKPMADAFADKLVGKPTSKKADWADKAVQATVATPAGSPVPTVGSPAWVRGDSQTSPWAVPWAMPAAAAAGTAGLVGGHQLIQYILRKKRKANLDQELAAAEKEFEEAMLSQYDPSKLRQLGAPKEASARTTALDYCFDTLEKRGVDFNELLGGTAGVYGVGAGALAAASALGTYHWFRSRSGAKLLQDALKRRAALRSLQNPPDLYVSPVPVEYVDAKK